MISIHTEARSDKTQKENKAIKIITVFDTYVVLTLLKADQTTGKFQNENEKKRYIITNLIYYFYKIR